MQQNKKPRYNAMFSRLLIYDRTDIVYEWGKMNK